MNNFDFFLSWRHNCTLELDEIDAKLDDVKRVLAKNDGGVIVLVPLKNVAGIEDKAALLKENGALLL